MESFAVSQQALVARCQTTGQRAATQPKLRSQPKLNLVASASTGRPAVFRTSLSVEAAVSKSRWGQTTRAQPSFVPCAVASDLGSESATGDNVRPTSSDTARTIVEISSQGALSTVSEDGWPLGTHMRYFLDEDGQPIIRLRDSALHTGNIERDSRVSLFIQPTERLASKVARCTLVGRVEFFGDSEMEAVGAKYLEIFGEGVGIDASRPDDKFGRLVIDKIFYVCGLGLLKEAEVIEGEEFKGATSDPLSKVAVGLVDEWNEDSEETLVRFASVFAGVSEEIAGAQMVWIDKMGFDMRVSLTNGELRDVRLPFSRAVLDERAARSALTLMGQLAWEVQKQYNPIAPTPMEETVQ